MKLPDSRSRPPCADDVLHCSHLELAAALAGAGQKVDALIVDAPYSERTHSGHDDGTAQANRVADWASRQKKRHRADGTSLEYLVRDACDNGGHRRALTYAAWTASDVSAFVAAWAPATTGWLISLTDHVLAPAWESALQDAGRYVFSPLACVEPGSRIRLTGDGPAQWSTWAVVSRPKDGQWLRAWQAGRRDDGEPIALPGAYVVGPGEGDTRTGRRAGARIPGGKPLSIMRALVSDYSRPGDLVCDPCAGGGTTGLAARLEGRHFIGCDIDAAHVELARERLRDIPSADKRGTLALFGGSR